MTPSIQKHKPFIAKKSKSSKTLFTPKMRRIFLKNMMMDRNAIEYMEFKRVIRNMPKHTRKAGNAK